MATENEKTTLVSDNETGIHEEVSASSNEESVSNKFLCAHCALRFNSSETRKRHVFNFHTFLLAIENHGGDVMPVKKKFGQKLN